LGVPYFNTPYIDHAEEVMLPASTLGRHFVVTQSLRRPVDYVRVTAMKDHCEVRKDGTLLLTLNAGQSFIFELTDDYPAIYLETSESAIVGKFFYGHDDIPGALGDPAMATILPMEQQTNRALFCAHNTLISKWHYLNIVTETASVSGMQLDGEPIDDLFEVVASKPEYAYARFQIADTTHILENTEGGFVAHVYGMGGAEAYSYFLDAAMLTTALTVNDTSEWLHPEGFCFDLNEPLDFNLHLNYEMTEARWIYGDGVTEVLTDTETSHSYSSRGNYPVTCEVFRTNAQGQRVLAGYVSTVIHAGYEGVESHDDAKECSLYPNPANSIVTIEGQNTTAVRLTNCIGQVVMEKACESIESMTLDLTELQTGIYMVEIISSSKRSIKQLVISR
jgi:hypothetical protein